MVLDVMYDKTGFDNEIARLDNQIVRNHNGADRCFYKKLKYLDDGVLYNCPVYVAIYRYDEYEYVCVDYETMRCIYVYMKYLSYDKIPLDEKYIPIDYQINELRKEEGGYMILYIHEMKLAQFWHLHTHKSSSYCKSV